MLPRSCLRAGWKIQPSTACGLPVLQGCSFLCGRFQRKCRGTQPCQVCGEQPLSCMHILHMAHSICLWGHITLHPRDIIGPDIATPGSRSGAAFHIGTQPRSQTHCTERRAIHTPADDADQQHHLLSLSLSEPAWLACLPCLLPPALLFPLAAPHIVIVLSTSIRNACYEAAVPNRLPI